MQQADALGYDDVLFAAGLPLAAEGQVSPHVLQVSPYANTVLARHP
jgi:hypothetical protein